MMTRIPCTGSPSNPTSGLVLIAKASPANACVTAPHGLSAASSPQSTFFSWHTLENAGLTVSGQEVVDLRMTLFLYI